MSMTEKELQELFIKHGFKNVTSGKVADVINELSKTTTIRAKRSDYVTVVGEKKPDGRVMTSADAAKSDDHYSEFVKNKKKS